MITAAQLHEIPGEVLHYVRGPLTAKVSRLLPPDLAQPEVIVFVSKQQQLEQALEKKASIIVALKALTLPETAEACLFTTGHLPLAIASVAPYFDKKIQRFQQEEHIHPKSSVHPTAHLGKNVIVGPCAVIGAEAHIGDGCIIGANSVIENHARIGHHTLIHPLVFIGAYCEVGAQCEIQPHATIGADGFGFVPLKGSHPVKIAQLGKVVLGDHVEIGASCTIDRAAMTETRIGSGTKLDNLIHIGHNCELGENTMAAAGFMMAGSSRVGKNFVGGGGTLVTDHVDVVDNVTIAGRSAVTNDITQAGQYGGYPLQPLKDSLKNIANLANLTAMRRQLSRIVKHLHLEE